MRRILLIEDDKDLNKGLVYDLEQNGFQVYPAFTLSEGRELLKDRGVDLILLDGSLPDGDGFAFCREVKRQRDIPVVFLTARDMEQDEMQGFDCGADDYITKPFNILEVKARIKAIIRRTGKKKDQKEDGKLVVKGDMKIDCESRRVVIGDREINLTAKEFDLLELLATHPNKVYSRENLLNLVWGYEYPGDVRTVDVHIRRLREKIEAQPSDPKYVYTKWGVGYYFRG